MLKIILGDIKDSIHEVSEYFNLKFKRDWLNDEFSKKAIKEVDKSTHIKDGYIESPVLGAISPRELSSGCKALILAKFDTEHIICGDRMGENCFPCLFELTKTQDVTITLSYIPFLMSDFSLPFPAYIENIGREVKTVGEFVQGVLDTRASGKLRYEEYA